MNSITGQSIVTAQQCLLNKDTIWLRDRPVFAAPNDPTLDVNSCHQSLLHGEQENINLTFNATGLGSAIWFCCAFNTNGTCFFVAGQSTSILSVEPEYSLPQNSIQGLDAASVDRLRRGPPEPYASSAIYTELNFKVRTDKTLGNPRLDCTNPYRVSNSTKCLNFLTISFNSNTGQ